MPCGWQGGGRVARDRRGIVAAEWVAGAGYGAVGGSDKVMGCCW